ncbi:MAG TPA: VWA domain-containing protein [Opitutaceae bacterium]|nr:VWA domain-containing protein [Opitutaceae bacterium]
MSDFTFHSPHWLWLLGLLPLLWWLRSRRGADVLVVPFAGAWQHGGHLVVSRWPLGLAAVGLVLLVVALARPQFVQQRQEERKEGYDLVLAIDVSGSMLSEDYERGGTRMNRLDALRPVLDAFIQRRPNDRIGLVVFAGRAYTLSPLTFDHDWLRRQTERLKVGLIEDGTAIGDGLGVALTRLEQAKREQSGKRLGAFVVLLTDGVNNKGALEPLQSAAIAKGRGIPVYTIGTGRTGYVPVPVFDRDGRKLGMRTGYTETDERTLQAIAGETGAEFFRATDTGTIESAFKAIDRSQKIEFQAKSYLLTEELFAWFTVPGGLLLAAAALIVRWPFGHRPAPARGAALQPAPAGAGPEVRP